MPISQGVRWTFNGTFVHDSLHPGISVGLNGGLRQHIILEYCFCMTWISSISSVVPANTGLYTCLVSGGRYNLTSGISESWFVFTSWFKGETLLLVRERTTPKKQPEGVRRPIEVVKKVKSEVESPSL